MQAQMNHDARYTGEFSSLHVFWFVFSFETFLWSLWFFTFSHHDSFQALEETAFAQRDVTFPTADASRSCDVKSREGTPMDFDMTEAVRVRLFSTYVLECSLWREGGRNEVNLGSTQWTKNFPRDVQYDCRSAQRIVRGSCKCFQSHIWPGIWKSPEGVLLLPQARSCWAYMYCVECDSVTAHKWRVRDENNS